MTLYEQLDNLYKKRDSTSGIELIEKNLNVIYEDLELLLLAGITYDQHALSLEDKGEQTVFLNKAMVFFEKALQIDRNSDRAMAGLGQVNLHLNNLEISLEWYREAQKINSQNFSHLISFGNIYRALGQFNKAIFWYKKALINKIANPIALANLALIYKQIGNQAQYSYYLKRLAIHPNLPEGLMEYTCQQLISSPPQ